MNNCTNHEKFRSCKAHFSTGSALGSASMLLQSLSNNSSPNIDEKNPGMAFILLLYCCHARPAIFVVSKYQDLHHFGYLECPPPTWNHVD